MLNNNHHNFHEKATTKQNLDIFPFPCYMRKFLQDVQFKRYAITIMQYTQNFIVKTDRIWCKHKLANVSLLDKIFVENLFWEYLSKFSSSIKAFGFNLLFFNPKIQQTKNTKFYSQKSLLMTAYLKTLTVSHFMTMHFSFIKELHKKNGRIIA